MKKSSSDRMANSQRIRANAVWLMNAASLAAAISAVNYFSKNGDKNFVSSILPQAKATDYTWSGLGSNTNITLVGNWSGTAAPALGTASSASNDTQTFGTLSGTGSYIVGIGSQKNLGQVTFAAMAGNTGYTLNSLSGTSTSTILGIAGGSSGSAMTNSFTNGTVTFNVIVANMNANNTWNSAAGSKTVFNSQVYMYSSGLGRKTTLIGAGDFTFNNKITSTFGTAVQTTSNAQLVIQSTGTTILAGNNDMRGQLNINLATNGSGTVQLNGDNSNMGLAGDPGNAGGGTSNVWSQADAATYAIRFTRGTVLLGNALGLGTQAFTLGTASTVTTDTVKVLTNGAYTIANNIYLGYTGGLGADFTMGGNTDNNSTFSGSIVINKTKGFISQVATTGSNKLTVSGAISAVNSGSTLTFDGDGAILASNTVGSGTGSNLGVTIGSSTSSSNRVVTLSGNNGFSNGLTINSGVLTLGNAGAINSTAGSENAVTWGAGTTNGTLRLNGNSVVVKSLSSTTGTPIIENANAANVVLTIGNSVNSSGTFSGVIQNGTGAGTLGINTAGTGTLTLSGANTYTGATNIVNGSKLNLTGSLASGSAVTVASGGTLSGTGTANGSVSIAGTVNPGTAGVGTLTTGATTLQSGGTLNIQFYNGSGVAGSTGWDLLSTGQLTISSTSGSKFNINLGTISSVNADTVGAASVFSNSTTKDYEIIRATSIVGSFDSSVFSLSPSFTNALNGGTWTLSQSGNSIYATFTVASNTYWSAGTWDTAASGTGGAGTWDGTNGWDSSKTATFAGASGGAVSVGTVSASQGIQFSTTGYTLSSGSITLSGASSTLNTITTDTGVSAEISTPLTGTNGAYKAGAGTLTLSGDNSNLTGGLTISAGTLKLGNNAALGASSSSVAVSNGAVLDLNGATVSNTNALSINGTGVLVNTGGDASYAGNLTLTGASSIVSTTGAISIGGTTALGGNNLTLTGGAGNITLSNTISGTGNITITPGGVGAVTLSGGVNNTGTILVNPSTTAGNTVISGNIGSNVTGVTLGVSGQNATASNTQILTLSGTNTYTGSVNVYSGTLKLGSSSALGNSANALNISAAVGAALDLNGNSTPNSLNLYGAGIGSNSGVLINSSSTAATVSGTVTFSGNSSIVASGGDITFSGAIKNNGATQRNITIGGNTSTVTNVYVNSGVLQASANPGYIQLQIGSSGSDKVKVSLLGTQVIAPNGLVKIAGGTLALQSGSTLSASNMTLGSGGSLSDNSTLLLTGGSNYTFGSLGVGGNLTLDTTDSASAVNITFTNGGNSDTNTNGGQTGSSSKRIIANLGVTATIGAGGSTTYFDLVGKSSTPTSDKLLRIEGAGDVIVNSILRDNPATGVTWKGGINKSGTGTLTLNAANTYTASTTINAGTVKLGSGSALGDSAAGVTVYSAGTLNLNGQTMTNTNALTLSGTVTNDSGTAATYAGLLTVAGNNAKLNASSGNITLSNAGSIGFSSGTGYTLNLDGAYNGTINSILAIGTGNLNKTGAGNWTLSGSGATYSGTTNITNGSITLGASNVIGSGAVTINGGTLALGANSDTVGTVTLTSGSITGSTGTLTSNADYAVSSGTISGILAGSVGLNKTGAGTVTLSGLNTYTGVTTINAGTLEIYNFGGTQGNTGGVGANPSSLGQATNVSSKLLVNGTLRYLGSGETTDKKIKSGSTVTIDSSGTGALVFTSSPGESWMTGTTNSVLTLTGSNTGNNTWRGDILDNTTVNSTGTTSLVKSGAGTWVLSSSLVSNFSGGTTINDGTLKTATGNINGDITNNSILEFTNTSAGSYAGAISGNGILNKSGAGAVTLSGVNNYSGATNISAGTLNIGSTGSIASSAVSVAKSATLKATNSSVPSSSNVGGITLSSGALIDLSSGSIKSPSLTVSALSGSDVTKISYSFGNSLVLTGGLTLNGNLNLTVDGTSAVAGSNNLITWTGDKVGSGTFNSTFSNSPSNLRGKLNVGTTSVSADYYNLASPTYATTTKDFGNVRTGATLSSQNINFANTTITNASYQDSLDVSGSKTNSAITLGNGFNVSAGNNANLSVSANTATAGSLADTITLSLTSNANSVSGLSNSSITPTGTIAVTGAVYDLAQAKFDGTALDFGYVHQGATVSSQNVAIGNKTITNASYQDKLDVSGSSDNASVSVTGFTGLAASTNGSSTSNLAVGVDSSTLGTLNGTLSLTLTSNANGVLGLSNGDATRSGSGNITTTGTVYSGQATWNTDGSGSWGKVSSGFGSNWGANQGSPGLDSGFTNTDTATFGSAITSDATVSLNGASPKLKSITFNNTNASYTLATGSSGDITLNAGASDSAATIAVTGNHTISAVLKGSSQIDKTGSGTLTLSGVNTYTGLTNVTNGTLNLASTGSIASSDVAVSKAATLKATNSAISDSAIVGGITLNSGALVDLTSGSLKATSLTVGALSGSDVTKISYTIGNSLALTGGLTLNGNLSIDLTSNLTSAGTYDVFTWSGSRSGSGVFALIDRSNSDWVMTGSETSGKYTITVTSAFTPGGNYNSGNITIPSGQTLGNVSGNANVSASAATTITGISGGTVTLNASGNTVGAISNGTLNLKSGGNTVDTISGGTVTVEGSGSTIAGLTGGSLNVKADTTLTSLTGGTLTVDSGVNAEVKAGTSTATITGAGNLLKSGNGKLTLSGTGSDYTGATKITGGELEVTNVAALGATSGVSLGTASSSTAATFNYSGGASTISQNITALSTSQSGNTVQNTGSGLLTLSGSLTKNGTVLTLSGGSNGINVTGNIVGANANSDLVVSSGVVTVSSANNYNGPTFIQNGATLIANNATATGLGIVNVANGGTLQAGTADNILTLTTGGFALSNGAHIKVYVDHIDITGLTSFVMDGVTHYDISNTAGSAYSTLFTSGALDVSGVTAGGITIDVYSSNANTAGLLRKPFYDFKFLEAGSITGLGSGLNIADLFAINTTNLKYADGSDSIHAQYAGQNLSYLVKMYTVQNGSNTVLMMSIPEPSTYGLGLGALALAAVAIRRRKQKKATV